MLQSPEAGQQEAPFAGVKCACVRVALLERAARRRARRGFGLAPPPLGPPSFERPPRLTAAEVRARLDQLRTLREEGALVRRAQPAQLSLSQARTLKPAHCRPSLRRSACCCAAE